MAVSAIYLLVEVSLAAVSPPLASVAAVVTALELRLLGPVLLRYSHVLARVLFFHFLLFFNNC
jgi:hypothetical protein